MVWLHQSHHSLNRKQIFSSVVIITRQFWWNKFWSHSKNLPFRVILKRVYKLVFHTTYILILELKGLIFGCIVKAWSIWTNKLQCTKAVLLKFPHKLIRTILLVSIFPLKASTHWMADCRKPYYWLYQFSLGVLIKSPGTTHQTIILYRMYNVMFL